MVEFRRKKDEKDDAEVSRWDAWLEEFYTGKGRPQWMAPLATPLEKMLEAKTAEERVAAGRVLVLLGKTDQALPVLLESARTHPRLRGKIARVLPWLTFERRVTLFARLRELASSEEASYRLVKALTEIPDHRVASLLWEQLAEDDLTLKTARGQATFGIGSPH